MWSPFGTHRDHVFACMSRRMSPVKRRRNMLPAGNLSDEPLQMMMFLCLLNLQANHPETSACPDTAFIETDFLLSLTRALTRKLLSGCLSTQNIWQRNVPASSGSSFRTDFVEKPV